MAEHLAHLRVRSPTKKLPQPVPDGNRRACTGECVMGCLMGGAAQSAGADPLSLSDESDDDTCGEGQDDHAEAQVGWRLAEPR
jgi:hypothetical protein